MFSRYVEGNVYAHTFIYSIRCAYCTRSFMVFLRAHQTCLNMFQWVSFDSSLFLLRMFTFEANQTERRTYYVMYVFVVVCLKCTRTSYSNSSNFERSTTTSTKPTKKNNNKKIIIKEQESQRHFTDSSNSQTINSLSQEKTFFILMAFLYRLVGSNT